MFTTASVAMMRPQSDENVDLSIYDLNLIRNDKACDFIFSMFFSCCRQPNVVVETQEGPEERVPNTPEQPKRSNRYLYDANHEQIIGIDNSGTSFWSLLLFRQCLPRLADSHAGSKYAPNRTIEVSTVPYEERLERAIQEEEDARRRQNL